MLEKISINELQNLLEHICNIYESVYDSDPENEELQYEEEITYLLSSIQSFQLMYGIQTLENNTIYMDLYYGNITINASKYTGYVYDEITETQKVVTGNHSKSNVYHIYQSCGYENTDWSNELPDYNRITAPDGTLDKNNDEEITWSNYIENNQNINSIITKWTELASASDRAPTSNRIDISGNSNFNITVENIWSTYQQISTARTTGSISFLPKSSSNLYLNFKRDNRLACIHCKENVNRV